MVLYDSAQRVVQDRIRAYYQKYLPFAQEVTEEQVAATGLKPGTPKFEKAFRDMVTAHLNARPKKCRRRSPKSCRRPGLRWRAAQPGNKRTATMRREGPPQAFRPTTFL